MSQHADREGRAAVRQKLSARTGQRTGTGLRLHLVHGHKCSIKGKRLFTSEGSLAPVL